MAIQRDTIKNWQGRIIGFVDTDNTTGNKVVRDFYGKILGKYNKRLNITQDFYGRLVSKGDRTMMLIDNKK